MPGLLDPSTLYPDFLDPTSSDIFHSPEYRRQRIFDTLGGIGAALLQAGSRPGVDFGSALASGLAGGLQAGAGSEDRLLKRMMVQSQITKNRQEQANESAWQNLFKTPIAASGATPSAGTPTSSGGAPWSPTTDAKDLVAHLVNRGLTPMQAAVAVGNFQQESGLNPTTVHDSGTGYGLGGWRLDRRDALNRYAGLKGGNVADPKLQADFFVDELKGRPEWQAFSQAQDPRTAASALMNYFRPAGWTPDNPTAGHGFDNRLQFANALFPGGTQIAQGDASGNPVQLAQATQPAFRPQTMQDVIQTIPPGVRQLIGAMPRKEGLPLLMKYADPGSEAVLDTQSNQVVFIPKTMVGREPRYQPVEGEKLNIERQRLTNEQRRTDSTIMNADVIAGNDGKPTINTTAVEAKKAISAAQGTDPQGHIVKALADDAIKRNSELQKGALTAQSAIGKLGSLQSLLDQISTNRFKGTTSDIKAAAKAAGVDLEAMGIKDDVGPTQAAAALTSLMALENRREMPGPMSNGDRDFLTAAAPAITKDPAGNKILIAIKKGDLQREVDIAKAAREYISSPRFKTNPEGLDDFIASKLEGKNYYDQTLLQSQKNATDDYLKNLPPPPSGFSVPGQPGASGNAPAPPAGFRIVR